MTTLKNSNNYIISLLIFLYLLINFFIYYINITKDEMGIDISFKEFSTKGIIALSIFISTITILSVILPKFFYFVIISFVFKFYNINKKDILYFCLLGYLPVVFNTLIVNFLDFYTNLKLRGMWRSEQGHAILGGIHYFDIIDTLTVFIIGFLVIKKIKGTYRDFILIILGWLILRILFFIINEVV